MDTLHSESDVDVDARLVVNVIVCWSKAQISN